MTAMVFVLLAASLVVLPAPATATQRLSIARADTEPEVAAPEADVADDPLAVATSFDLLAACLRAGLTMSSSAAAVSTSSPQPLADSLRRASDLLSLGAEPTVAWEAAAGDPATESLARMARRSARSGASLAGAMTELAARHRTDAEDASAAKAERAGVLISGPLGLCFLPAFVCLGIVPVVIGLASRVLDGGLL